MASVALMALLTFLSCKHDPSFDMSLIIGKWVSGTEYWRYDNDSTGVTWDEGDDVHEDEAQPFTWSFDDETNTLTHVHQMEMGGVVPKSYTMTQLDDTKLEYRDRFGQTYSFERVNSNNN